MKPLTLAAPAKLNLFLHVTGRRDDGYHLLESLFALLDFADTLSLATRDDGAIVRANDVPGIPAAADLAVRAATLLREATCARTGVQIGVHKRIPLGAGLGGGSSDAATVLLGLNRLWRLDLSRSELASIGAKIGADVPFFLNGENAVVRGIGERVQPVSLPRRWFALAMPRVNVPTAQIFGSPALTRNSPSAKISVFSESYGRNDLEPVTASRYPEVARALAMLEHVAGHARMTGSGGAAYAACESAEAARRVVDAMPREIAGRVVATLPRHPLASFAR